MKRKGELIIVSTCVLVLFPNCNFKEIWYPYTTLQSLNYNTLLLKILISLFNIKVLKKTYLLRQTRIWLFYVPIFSNMCLNCGRSILLTFKNKTIALLVYYSRYPFSSSTNYYFVFCYSEYKNWPDQVFWANNRFQKKKKLTSL